MVAIEFLLFWNLSDSSLHSSLALLSYRIASLSGIISIALARLVSESCTLFRSFLPVEADQHWATADLTRKPEAQFYVPILYEALKTEETL